MHDTLAQILCSGVRLLIQTEKQEGVVHEETLMHETITWKTQQTGARTTKATVLLFLSVTPSVITISADSKINDETVGVRWEGTRRRRLLWVETPLGGTRSPTRLIRSLSRALQEGETHL